MSETRMRILSTGGIVEADLSDPGHRSNVGGHWSAIGYYTDNGFTDRLEEFEGVEVGEGIRLETDPDAIDGWWFAGELDFLEVYVS